MAVTYPCRSGANRSTNQTEEFACLEFQRFWTGLSSRPSLSLSNRSGTRFSLSSVTDQTERSAHDAVRQSKQYLLDGYTYIVDMDLSKFFDRVNHDRLMNRLASKIKDKRVLKLIRRYLDAGTMINGCDHLH